MSDALRRYLAQQIELGGRDVFLDAVEADTLRALLAGGLSLPATTPSPAASLQDAAGLSVASAPPAPSSTSPARVPPQPSPVARTAGDAYEALREEALGCTRCRLAEGRTQVVFSDGVPDARLVVVGEAPGANEDATGLPFVGAAGQLLDLLLAAVGLSRTESVYICNVLKCRPPGNRNPLPDEIEACSSYLKRQLALVQPEALLAVGTFSAQLLTGTSDPIGKLRGTVHTYEGTPLVVTYHPAALLRNQGWTRLTWDDLQLLRDVMDASA